ncbi:MAG: hypothetical protein GF334_02710 [Candidatus Altiarchaeales archaeon]|nr:hypothetical protein [Candidatus Altiarchaeales archaeon]
MTKEAEKVAEKFDSVLAEVSKVLIEAADKYGPDVGAYAIQTVYYDAIQLLVYLCISFVCAVFFGSILSFSLRKVFAADSTEKEIENFGIISVCVSPFALVSTFFTVGLATNVYMWQTLLGDPKITLTKQLMEKLL